VACVESRIQFASPLPSRHSENQTVYGDFFAAKGPGHWVERRAQRPPAAVVILGHWNSKADTYNKLARIYSLNGISALRLSLPYHDERRPASMPIASGMLSADLNLTIHSVRQAVIETRIAVEWLKQQGYERIGVVGASLGSFVATLTSSHEPLINAQLGYLFCADLVDLVWRSTATQHIRESLEHDVPIDALHDVWSPVSPATHLRKLKRGNFTLHVGIASYDTICPADLSQRMLDELSHLGVQYETSYYPCGHNTLSMAPFMHLSGWNGLRFMRRQLLKD
jgi:pimeloyl-ACP methyl ester carboxylesterase